METVVSRVQPDFVTSTAINAIKDLPSLKNPFQKRKHGIRLLLAVAKAMGEEGFDADPQVMKLVLDICHDNNYKIRRDGVLFFRDYFQDNIEKVVEHERFQELYLPELFDYLNDEDLHIQLDVIEIFIEVLDYILPEQVEEEFMPQLLPFLDVDNQHQHELTLKMTELLGPIVFKLKKYDLHMKHGQEIIDFFKEMCDHKEQDIREKALYNLPCMHLLYKHKQNEFDISFYQLYNTFSIEPDHREQVAKCLHEAFKLVDVEEDLTDLLKCFISYLVDDEKDLLIIITQNLDIFIQNYSNMHTLANFKGRTAYTDNNSEGDNSRKGSLNSNNEEKLTGSNKKSLKKRNTVQLQPSTLDLKIPEEEALPPIYVASGFEQELVYSDMFHRLMVMINNIRSFTSLWREQCLMIKHLTKVIHLFYMPELHE